MLHTNAHGNGGSTSIPVAARRSVGDDGNGNTAVVTTGNDSKELTLLRGQYEELVVVKRVLDARIFELQQQVHQQSDQTTLQTSRVEKAERDKQRAESELQRVEADLQVIPCVPIYPLFIAARSSLLLLPQTLPRSQPRFILSLLSYTSSTTPLTFLSHTLTVIIPFSGLNES